MNFAKLVCKILATALFAAVARADDETDFSTNPAAAWQRLDPLGRATYDFSSATCRINVTAPTVFEAQILGPARAALLAPTAWSDTVVCADLLAWNPEGDRAFTGVLARVQSPAGIAATRGSSLAVLHNPPVLQLYRLDNEVPTLLASSGIAALNRTHRYRFVLVCAGTMLTGKIYDNADLLMPIVTLTASDTTYAAGRAGVFITTDRVVALTATFDNFLAWNGDPPPLTIVPTFSSETVIVSWDALRGLGSQFEQSADLMSWGNATPFFAVLNGSRIESSFSTAFTPTFFRRRLLGH